MGVQYFVCPGGTLPMSGDIDFDVP